LASSDAVVIVGSGPPGATATLLLAKAGVDVTLLEAGLPSAARGLTARVAGITIARKHRELVPRSDGVAITGDPGTLLYEDVAPGGLTNHWSCAVPRFSREDFLDARRAGEAYAWPIDYEDLAPWYDWVEPWLRISGATTDVAHLPSGKICDSRALGATWQPAAELARLDGQALVPVPYTYGAQTTLTFSGTVFNSFVRLVKPAQRTGHVTVRYGAKVIELEWSGANKRVEAVIVRDSQTGATDRIRCRAVILAAGAINTTRILFQSKSADFPDGLGNTNGVLGRYLHDHPLGKVEIDVASPLSFHPAAYLTRRPLERCTPLYAAACPQWSGVKSLARSLLKGQPGRLTSCGFSIFGTMAPTVENFVALDPSRPAADGSPGLVLNIKHPVESAQALEAARDQLVSLLDRAGLRPEVGLWLIDSVGSAIHFGGTCRMHSSPQFGMLDRWNRLHAVRNVVVADSAAFTTGPEKNPVVTAMALAARASQQLVDDLRGGLI